MTRQMGMMVMMTNQSFQRVDPVDTRQVFEDETKAAGGKEPPVAIGNVADAVVQFTKVEVFTTFLAEYAFMDGDIVVHFFPAKELYILSNDRWKLSEEVLLKWQRQFPLILSPVAERYFSATYPTLSALYVAEMTSWYLRAGGFAKRLNPDEFIMRFFEQLDHALDCVDGVKTFSA